MTGAERIAAERQRQIDVEGWTPEHDDAHDQGELLRAAFFYAAIGVDGLTPDEIPARPEGWPWALDWWKPSLDPIRNLERAGALIAAEIDRLLRARERGGGA